MKENETTSHVEHWRTDMETRVNALPLPSAIRTRMLFEEGQVYEFIRIASTSGLAVDDDLLGEIEDELATRRNALHAITAVVVRRGLESLFTCVEMVVTDAELLNR